MSDNSTTRPIIVGLGEVLWDVFPDGPRFGGAPANFACAASALSPKYDVYMVSSVGDDDPGHQAQREFADRNVDTSALAVSTQPTGAVYVSLDDTGSASYRFAEDTAWDRLTWNSQLQDLAG